MLDTHLSSEQVQQYQRYALAPDQIAEVYTHLEGCNACRARVAVAIHESTSPTALAADLLIETLLEPEHLSDEQMAALANGDLQPADREIVMSHLETCEFCRAEAAQVQALRALLQELPEVEFAPLPHAASTLQDFAGPVLAGVSELPGQSNTRALPRALAERLRELVDEGLVTPIRSIQAALSIWRSANLPAPALRGQSQPIPLSPVATSIRVTPPTLRWAAVPGAEEYTVLLAHQATGTARNLLWKETLQHQTEVTVPVDVALQPGALYLWQVTATVNGAHTRSSFAWFVPLSDRESHDVQKAERIVTGSAVALAGLYERYGLYDEAESQLKALADTGSDSHAALQMLERLHAQRGQD